MIKKEVPKTEAMFLQARIQRLIDVYRWPVHDAKHLKVKLLEGDLSLA